MKIAGSGRQLLLASALAAVAAACGSSGSGGDAAGSGATGGTSGTSGSGPIITIELPPPVEDRLKKLIRELAPIICQRSRNCCSSYGFHPLSDCTEMAGGPFLLDLSSVIFDGAENFDYSIDEALATACLDAARSVVNDCSFATESLFYAWTTPCMDALRVTKKGDVPIECRDDIECTARQGSGHVCYNQKCLALAEVATGGSCAVPDAPTNVPVCGASDYCNAAHVCATPAALGADCDGEGGCVPPYACGSRDMATRSGGTVCLQKAAQGERCERDDQCIDGSCACSLDVGCDKMECMREAHFGDACKTDDDCFGVFAFCLDGRCKPPQMTLCQPVAQ